MRKDLRKKCAKSSFFLFILIKTLWRHSHANYRPILIKILLFNRNCPKKDNSKLKLRKKYVCATHWSQKVVFPLYFNKNFMTSQLRQSPSNFDKKKILVFNRKWPKKHNSILKLYKKYVCATHWSQKLVTCKKRANFGEKRPFCLPVAQKWL